MSSITASIEMLNELIADTEAKWRQLDEQFKACDYWQSKHGDGEVDENILAEQYTEMDKLSIARSKSLRRLTNLRAELQGRTSDIPKKVFFVIVTSESTDFDKGSVFPVYGKTEYGVWVNMLAHRYYLSYEDCEFYGPYQAKVNPAKLADSVALMMKQIGTFGGVTEHAFLYTVQVEPLLVEAGLTVLLTMNRNMILRGMIKAFLYMSPEFNEFGYSVTRDGMLSDCNINFEGGALDSYPELKPLQSVVKRRGIKLRREDHNDLKFSINTEMPTVAFTTKDTKGIHSGGIVFDHRL